ncbi:MAG: UpxY family transcription antiterminator [Bacteroidales bacterium]|nr:UpxY family transcription antiterminator [Bacteroidales bacterium]
MAEQVCWFVAYVKSCQEKKAAQALERLGVEHFLPLQRVRRKWSDRMKWVDRLVIPRMIFVKTTPSRRVKLLEDIPYIYAFMVQKGAYTPVVVPDYQMDAFKMMVCHSEADVTIESRPMAAGDKVRILDGPLAGLECVLVEVLGKRHVTVDVGILGTATVELAVGSVVKI